MEGTWFTGLADELARCLIDAEACAEACETLLESLRDEAGDEAQRIVRALVPPTAIARVLIDLIDQPPQLVLAACRLCRDSADAQSYARGRDEAGTLCRILGEVSLWGHVLETEGGWRASHAYPCGLFVPDLDIAAELAVYGVAISSATCASRSSPTCTATPSRSAPRLPT